MVRILITGTRAALRLRVWLLRVLTTYYTVTVSDGCTVPDVSESMEAIIYPLPVIAFTADTTNGCYPVCVTFTDNSTIASGSLMSWNWNFGDGNVSAAKNPTDCYTNPGSYNVSVTITSNNGCPFLSRRTI